MTKIPFTLEAWLKDKSQKVETRDGRSVKIISFEMTDTNDCPIAAQFRLCAGTPVVYLFDKEGHYKGEGYSDFDLFIVTPKKELSEFEEEVRSWMSAAENLEIDNSWVKNCAKILLSSARKELEPEIKAEALKEFEAQCKVSSDIEHGLAYGLGYKAGRADALIDEITKIPGFKEDER